MRFLKWPKSLENSQKNDEIPTKIPTIFDTLPLYTSPSSFYVLCLLLLFLFLTKKRKKCTWALTAQKFPPKLLIFQKSHLGIWPNFWEFWDFQCPCTLLPPLLEEEVIEKKREMCKGEGCHKLLGFSWEFHHFFGNFAAGDLAIFKFPKFPTFLGIPQKSLGFSKVPSGSSQRKKASSSSSSSCTLIVECRNI